MPKAKTQSRYIPKRVKEAVRERDRNRCRECGDTSYLEFDHITPHSKGAHQTPMKIFVLVGFLLAMSSIAVAQSSNRQLLRSMHRSLNEMCRGGSGDSQITKDACDVRTKVSSLLKTTGSGKTESNGEQALSIYKDLNEMCRGYSGDLPETDQACDIRNKVSALLKNSGYYWSGSWWKKRRS